MRGNVEKKNVQERSKDYVIRQWWIEQDYESVNEEHVR